MIKVTVELVPFGDNDKKKELGSLKIINDGTGTLERGNYNITFTEKDMDDIQHEITNWPRSELKAWDLVYRILDDLLS